MLATTLYFLMSALNFKASAVMISTLPQSFRVSAKIATIFLSFSMAITLPADSANSCVNVPMPGPISKTVSSGFNSADFIIFSKTFLSIKKF